MDIIDLLPNLRMLRFPVGQAYLWRDPDSLTLVDTGLAGAGPDISRAITGFGLQPTDLDRVVLTHFHEDYTGSATEVGAWDDVTVLAHRREAPIIRGQVPGPPPVLTDDERELLASIVGDGLPPAPPARVDRELEDGDVLPFGGGAHVLAVPGHTDGSIAIYLPQSGVLFTGATWRPTGTATSFSGPSTSTDPKQPGPSGGWPLWTAQPPYSVTAIPSSSTRPPCCVKPAGTFPTTRGSFPRALMCPSVSRRSGCLPSALCLPRTVH